MMLLFSTGGVQFVAQDREACTCRGGFACGGGNDRKFVFLKLVIPRHLSHFARIPDSYSAKQSGQLHNMDIGRSLHYVS